MAIARWGYARSITTGSVWVMLALFGVGLKIGYVVPRKRFTITKWC